MSSSDTLLEDGVILLLDTFSDFGILLNHDTLGLGGGLAIADTLKCQWITPSP